MTDPLVHASLQQELLQLVFRQSLTGIFVMMLDEPIVWDADTDKEKVLDYVFTHQRTTLVNQAMIDQYRSSLEDFLGRTPSDFSPDNPNYGREVWRKLFDQGSLHIDTLETRKDGTPMHILGDYICLYDDSGRITGHFGMQIEITDQKTLESELKASEAKFRNLLENAPYPILVSDVADNVLRYGNRKAKTLFGVRGEEGVGMNSAEFYRYPEDRTRFLRELALKGSVEEFETEVYDYHRRAYTALLSATISQFDGRPAIIVSINDISHRKAAEEELRQEKERYRLIAENTTDVIWLYNITQDRMTYTSPSVMQLRGFTPEEAITHTLTDLVDQESYALIQQLIATEVPYFLRHPDEPRTYLQELRQPCKDGSLIWTEVSARLRLNEAGEVELLGVTRNIDDRKKVEAEIQFMSFHDPLTGLFNRNFLDKRAIEEMLRADRNAQPLSMIEFDLDHFKTINDAWGHPTGDMVLKKCAEIADSLIRRSDILVRMGGEEFVILLPETDLKGANIVAEKIREAIHEFRHPFVGSVSASFGVAQRHPAESFISWYKRLDDALYQAKRSGRNRVRDAGEQVSVKPMTSLEWHPGLASGNLIIDREHRDLIRVTNRLVRLTQSEADAKLLTHEFKVYLERINHHFIHEIATLSVVRYPGTREHEIRHQQLFTQAQAFLDAVSDDRTSVQAFLAFAVDQLIIGHIFKEDADYFPHLKRNP